MTTPTTSPKRGEFDVESARAFTWAPQTKVEEAMAGTLKQSLDEIDRLRAELEAERIANQLLREGMPKDEKLFRDMIWASTGHHTELCKAQEERDAYAKRVEGLRAAGDKFMASFSQHYSGFPGKLQWPEIHRLKQELEALATSDGGGEG